MANMVALVCDDCSDPKGHTPIDRGQPSAWPTKFVRSGFRSNLMARSQRSGCHASSATPSNDLATNAHGREHQPLHLTVKNRRHRNVIERNSTGRSPKPQPDFAAPFFAIPDTTTFKYAPTRDARRAK